VHDTLESLYKCIGMEVLPDEYLPDDYTGPSGGPLKQIIRTYSHYTNMNFRRSPSVLTFLGWLERATGILLLHFFVFFQKNYCLD